MRGVPLTKKKLPLCIAILFLACAGITGGVFFSRPPVLVVTDSMFIQLYGAGRLGRNRRRLSAALFRRVIPVVVDENARPDLVAIAASDAFDSPFAVLFPYRYLAGARVFREQNPEIPALVMGGEQGERAENEGLVFVSVDTETDLRRAGLAAARLADGKKVLVFDTTLFPNEYRDTLTDALAERGGVDGVINGTNDGVNDGVIDAPVFLNVYSDYASYDEVGCVILTGPANRFLERNLDIPVILFSWIDPEMTSHPVKIIFDDSAWALAADAVRSLSRHVPGEGIVVPSVARIMRERFDEKEDFRLIREIFKENSRKK